MEVRKDDVVVADDGIEVLKGKTEFTEDEIRMIQEKMFQIGSMQRKTSGGNKYRPTKAKRIVRRKMQRASRKINRQKKK